MLFDFILFYFVVVVVVGWLVWLGLIFGFGFDFVQGAKIGDEGVNALAEALKTNNSIQSIDLGGKHCFLYGRFTIRVFELFYGIILFCS